MHNSGIYSEFFLFNFIKLFLCVFFILLKFFAKVYDSSFKICALESIEIILIGKHFYRTGRFRK